MIRSETYPNGFTVEDYRGSSGPEGSGRPPGSLGSEWPTGFSGHGWCVRDADGEIVFADAWRYGCLRYVGIDPDAEVLELDPSFEPDRSLLEDGPLADDGLVPAPTVAVPGGPGWISPQSGEDAQGDSGANLVGAGPATVEEAEAILGPDGPGYGGEGCSCRLYDDGDGESGPRLQVDANADCPLHGPALRVVERDEADPGRVEALEALLAGRGHAGHSELVLDSSSTGRTLEDGLAHLADPRSDDDEIEGILRDALKLRDAGAGTLGECLDTAIVWARG